MAILLVEDEWAIAEGVVAALELERLEVVHAGTLAEAHEVLAAELPVVEVVILDVGLPDGSGFELCRQLRAREDGGPGVVFLTARSEVVDRVLGLELGGDDYVPKPFSPRELVARVKAVLRRVCAAEGGAGVCGRQRQQGVEREADDGGGRGLLWHDEKRARLVLDGVVLALSRNEYFLLLFMLRRPGRVFSRGQLLEGVWEDPWATGERSVDAHVKSVRAKLREVLPDRELIVTHRGLGYSLVEGL